MEIFETRKLFAGGERIYTREDAGHVENLHARGISRGGSYFPRAPRKVPTYSRKCGEFVFEKFETTIHAYPSI